LIRAVVDPSVLVSAFVGDFKAGPSPLVALGLIADSCSWCRHETAANAFKWVG